MVPLTTWITEIPPGMELIFSAYFTDSKGVVRWAKAYGKRAWAFLVPIGSRPFKSRSTKTKSGGDAPPADKPDQEPGAA